MARLTRRTVTPARTRSQPLQPVVRAASVTTPTRSRRAAATAAPSPSISPVQTPPGAKRRPPLGLSDLNATSPKKPRLKAVATGDPPTTGQAQRWLATSSPDAIIGREPQMDQIRSFLARAWETGPGPRATSAVKRSLYVSGAPGTGKTACVHSLIRQTQAGPSAAFRVVFVNCMSLQHPKDVYAKVAEGLGCPSTADPATTVERALTACEPCLLVLDEVDQLESQGQAVLYTLFEWPYLPRSRLVLLGIANALDMTDRVLPRLKTYASVMPLQIAFPPYEREEIFAILSSRLNDENTRDALIQPAALRFLAGKISAVSGDVRKALDVCRRAIEVTEIQKRKRARQKTLEASPSPAPGIDIPCILRIFNEVYSSRVTAAIQNQNSDLPLQHKILMAALLLLTRRAQAVSLGRLQETYARICAKRSVPSLDSSELVSICHMLEMRGFAAVKRTKKGSVREAQISLRIDENEVEQALQDQALLTAIIHDPQLVATPRSA
eukprot:maker-scaffold1646_size32207-snap-gene-0.7 protein:Tk02694 transcript:maker-scaffold1646_size32207-snap-gene-0.7-mRNA-1 annotation:"hypothetical protein BRAFLDRAFT_123390"